MDDPIFNKTVKDIINDISSISKALNTISFPIDVDKIRKEISYYNSYLQRLKKAKPDCANFSSPEEYEIRYENFKEFCDKVRDYAEDIVESYKEKRIKFIQLLKEIKNFEIKIKIIKDRIDFLYEFFNDRKIELKNLKGKYVECDEKSRKLIGECQQAISTLDDAIKKLGNIIAEIDILYEDTHEWVDDKINFPAPSSRPDEFRTIEKIVGKKCKKCGATRPL